MALSALLIVFGIVLLIVGADALVSGASRIAQRFNIPPLIIGLTVVALGTSMPEITVSTTAALAGNTQLALGNVVGSNIFNVLLILGLAAVILPLSVNSSLVRQEVPVMVGLSFLLLIFLLDGVLSAVNAAVLLAIGIAYIALLVVQTRRASMAGDIVAIELPDETGWAAKVPSVMLVVAGLAGLVFGAQLLVKGASQIALSIGVSELVIGLTVVAIGTSLPEVAASVAAALKGQRDMAIGNVVGSNIFNIAFCLGLAGTVAPTGLLAPSQLLSFDLIVMLLVAIAVLPLIFTDYEVRRSEGALLLLWCALYLVWTLLIATDSDLLSSFASVMLYVMAPATLVFLVFTVLIAIRGKRGVSSK